MAEESEKLVNGDYYDSTYTMREQGRGIVSTIPKDVVKRKARKKGLTVETFSLTHNVRAMYDDFSEMDYGAKFIEKDDKEKLEKLKSRRESIKENLENDKISKEEAYERIDEIDKVIERVED